MISHYLNLARKGLMKNKYYTFINVFGLVAGMLSALIISKYIGGSLQFDSFHVNREHIYSIAQKESSDGQPEKESRNTYWGTGDLLTQYPEIAGMTRFGGNVESVVQTDGSGGDAYPLLDKGHMITASSFFRIFTFPMVQGNPSAALSRSNSVVITKTTAQRYFGAASPMGKTLTIRQPWGQETVYEVTGVVEDAPKKSRFKFDFLITQPPVDPLELWTVPETPLFVLLKDHVDVDAFSEMIARALDHVEPLKSTNRKVVLMPESIAAVKLTNTELLLVAVGVFIVVISWLNYINQIVAQSYLRTKEVGILRVLGSTKANLKTQFVIESSLICVTSLMLVLLGYLMLEPSLQSLTNGHLLPLLNDPTPVNFVFLLIFVVGIAFAAIVPAVILFSQDFATTLRSGYSSKVERLGLRKSLVIIQFSISTMLVIGIVVITDQLEFMRMKDKGIEMESILILKDPISMDSTWLIKRKTLEAFKEKCAQLPFVTKVASSTMVPGDEYRHETYLTLDGNEQKTLVHLTGVDEKFFDLYRVQFMAGHNFVPGARFKNRTSIILNESAARALGIFNLDKMIDTKVFDQDSEKSFDVIGIIKDYHQTSVKYDIKPMAFQYNDFTGHFSLLLNEHRAHDLGLKAQLAAIKEIWDETYHDAAFDTFFVEQKYEAQDDEDRSFGKLFEYFTILSVVISCLGLFGLSLLISTKRRREIGIRKSFGATSKDILTIFLKGYAGSLCVAVIVGVPAAYLLMRMWLRNYAYRIEIGVWPIALAVISLTMIFFLTVSYHTIKASLENPVNVLRD